MFTSLCTLGLMLAPTLAAPDSPAWLTSYSAALDAGIKSKKPVAVFVGSGEKGQGGLLKDGPFAPETLKILADKYVCVYLDRSQSANENIIRELAIGKTGLVISDRTGNYQALHHDGVVTQKELAQQLRRFADPALTVSQTTSNTYSRSSFYGGAGGLSSNFASPRTVTVNC